MEVEELVQEMELLSIEPVLNVSNEVQKFYDDLCRKHNKKLSQYTVQGLAEILEDELEALYSVYQARYTDITLEEFKNRVAFDRAYNIVDGRYEHYWYVCILNMKHVAAYIPEDIHLLAEMTTLVYSWNCLSTLPEGLFRLTRLDTLDLSHNSLKEIPDSIAGLVNLRQLLVDHNKISKVSSKLYSLSDLRYIDLSYNPLYSMPAGIDKLKRLVTLRLHHTYMREYPEGCRSTMSKEELKGDYNTTCISWKKE